MNISKYSYCLLAAVASMFLSSCASSYYNRSSSKGGMVENGGSQFFNPLQGVVDIDIGVGGYAGGGYCPPPPMYRGGYRGGYCPPPRYSQPCPPRGGIRPPGYGRYGGGYRGYPPAPYHGGGRNIPGSGWSRNAEIYVPHTGTGAIYMR